MHPATTKWTRFNPVLIVHFLLPFFPLAFTQDLCGNNNNANFLEKASRSYVDQVLNVDRYNLLPGVYIEKYNSTGTTRNSKLDQLCSHSKLTLKQYLDTKLDDYLSTHVLSINLPQTVKSRSLGESRNSFLTGFGMGFLAFGLKKLLLPVFIGAQLLKSVLIAMFLPSILGSLGKILGKGLSTFSGISSGGLPLNHNANNAGAAALENFEFKDDITAYNAQSGVQEYGLNGEADGSNDTPSVATSPSQSTNNRLGDKNKRYSYHLPVSLAHNDNYYLRKPSKATNYKVFHKIPASSLLLTTYDPFYSPLLSRIDAVFQQLGLPHDKSKETEKCRERLVCLMYANPTKYVPYSNLVSAQLSRELNELRKPSTDNPEILRFFRYMKAAKDGQEGGGQCKSYGGCPALDSHQTSPVILATYNSINKLVQARKL